MLWFKNVLDRSKDFQAEILFVLKTLFSRKQLLGHPWTFLIFFVLFLTYKKFWPFPTMSILLLFTFSHNLFQDDSFRRDKDAIQVLSKISINQL